MKTQMKPHIYSKWCLKRELTGHWLLFRCASQSWRWQMCVSETKRSSVGPFSGCFTCLSCGQSAGWISHFCHGFRVSDFVVVAFNLVQTLKMSLVKSDTFQTWEIDSWRGVHVGWWDGVDKWCPCVTQILSCNCLEDGSHMEGFWGGWSPLVLDAHPYGTSETPTPSRSESPRWHCKCESLQCGLLVWLTIKTWKCGNFWESTSAEGNIALWFIGFWLTCICAEILAWLTFFLLEISFRTWSWCV